jgi:hypothetical protein
MLEYIIHDYRTVISEYGSHQLYVLSKSEQQENLRE